MLRLEKDKLLFLLLLIGFLLRVSVIFWGILPSAYIHCETSACYHPDENDSFNPIIHFPENYFSARRFLGYGTTMPLLIGLPLLPIKVIAYWLLNLHYQYGVLAILAARFFSVILGAGVIFLIYKLAIKLFQDKRIAFVSALLMTVSSGHVLCSAISKPTIVMGFFLILNMLLAIWAVEQSTKKSYFILGIFSSLLIGLKLDGIFFIPIPILLSLLLKKFRLGNHFIYLGTIGLFFLLMQPYIFLNFGRYVTFMVEQKRNYVDRLHTSLVDLVNIWFGETGVLIVPFFIGGVFLMGKKNWRLKVLPLVYLILFYGFWRWGLKSEFATIVIPFFILYASVFFVFLMTQKNRIIRHFGYFCLGGVFFLSLATTLLSIYARYDDSRTRAAQYIMEKIPAGTSLGFSEVSTEYSWIEHDWRYPQIDLERYVLKNFLEKPDILVVSSFDTRQIKRGLESDKLGPGYIWDEHYKNEWYRYIPPTPEVFAFYDKLFNRGGSEYLLIKEFKYPISTTNFVNESPEISIYWNKDSKLNVF